MLNVDLKHFRAQASYVAQHFYTCSHRESLSPTQDLTETTDEESADHPSHSDRGDSNHKSYFDMSPESTEARPPSPSTSKSEVTCSTHGRHGQALASPAISVVSANIQKSQPQESDLSPFQGIKAGADTIRRALLRSSRARREVKADTGSFALTKLLGEKQTEQKTQERLRASQNNTAEEKESAPNRETVLLGYDAQWRWVESQDDVTFL